jgi:6-phosphogluconolactonase
MPTSLCFFDCRSLKLLSITLYVVLVAGANAFSQGSNGAANAGKHQPGYFVYVGTYTGPNSKGIYLYHFDEEQGQLSPLGLAGEIVNPSFVVTDPAQRHLYAVSEISKRDPNTNKASGSISSFAIDPKDGSLKFLNTVPSGGGGPCHLVVDKTGKILFVANYGSGSVASFAIEDDGSIGAMTGFDQHAGSSVNVQRQQGPHAHSVVISPDNRFLFVPDLGLDHIVIYRIDVAKRTFAVNDPAYVSVRPGLGPRHFVFGSGSRFAYAICEMGSSVVAFSYDRAKGSLTPVQTISTLPDGFSGEDGSAEIQISSSGHFLYASNRGNDSITEFHIDGKTGLLTKIQVVPTQGKMPRNFVIDPTGKYLLAANQNSNNIVVFRINPDDGQLSPANQVVDAPSPVSLLFIPETESVTAAK